MLEEEELLDHRKASNYELERPLVAQAVTEANTLFKEFLETKKQPRESQERGGRASARENLFKLRFKTPVKIEEVVILPDVEEMREKWLKRKEEQHHQHRELFPIQPDSVSHIERAQAPDRRAEPVEDQISSVTVILVILMILDRF